jgi:hypothetical protein
MTRGDYLTVLMTMLILSLAIWSVLPSNRRREP